MSEPMIYQLALGCRFCGGVLRRYGPEDPWLVSSLLNQLGNRECPDAPNPDDGPMPGHEPGTPAVTNPEWPGVQEAGR